MAAVIPDTQLFSQIVCFTELQPLFHEPHIQTDTCCCRIARLFPPHAASETNATAKAAAPGQLPAEVPAANATEAKSRDAPAANETIATPKAPSSAATAAAGFVSMAAAALVALML
jgi:hypothetical protein